MGVKQITSKTEFDNAAARLVGGMVSVVQSTRQSAAREAAEMLGQLPKDIANNKAAQDDIKALKTLIERVNAERL